MSAKRPNIKNIVVIKFVAFKFLFKLQLLVAELVVELVPPPLLPPPPVMVLLSRGTVREEASDMISLEQSEAAAEMASIAAWASNFPYPKLLFGTEPVKLSDVALPVNAVLMSEVVRHLFF